ncbi:hypothetical protein E2C01_082431 [Portunus trituberculatus]|uniref:Uncharacterized protein n=1 Tax=Portunus trituberculatus TaxID=210409 RepID=A0A5B7IYG9_PORTR|nr:hypothetical protein [Portunus trituberculatus]
MAEEPRLASSRLSGLREPERRKRPSLEPLARGQNAAEAGACLTVSDIGVAKGGGKEGGERADSQTPTRTSRESPTGSRGVLSLADGLGTGALWARAAD